MQKAKLPVYRKTLFSWAFSGNLRLQMLLLLLIVAAVFSRVLPLEMQKRVVNEAIKLQRFDLLTLYCGIYLAAVVAASSLKFAITTLQNLISERALASMRQELFEHILTLPLHFFRKAQPGTVVSFLLTELSTAGVFAGIALTTPLINILTLLAFAGYLFWLNPLLAGISLSIYPLALILIPFLQRGTNNWNKRRVDASREMSSKIAESVSGIHEIQGNGAYRIENSKFYRLAERLLHIRIVWNIYRTSVKVANNLFTSFGPLLIFILGGYLTMNGKLELGALVAFLSAQEKLYDPWKELIEYYQVYQDASVRYDRTMNYFAIQPEYDLLPVGRAPYRLAGKLEVSNLAFDTEEGVRLLDQVSFSLQPGEQMALVGFSGSGKSTLVQCIGQLYKYNDGQVLLDGKEVADMSKQDVTGNIGFIAQNPFIFSGTMEENLLYACKAQEENQGQKQTSALPSLDQMIEVLQQTGLFTDVLGFGLNAMLDQKKYADMAPLLVRMRKNFQEHFGEELADYIEFFREDAYHYYSSVADNIIFGTPSLESFSYAHLHQNRYFLDFLGEADLKRPLLRLGAELARQTVDILGNLPPKTVFFEQSPILPEELDDCRDLVHRLRGKRLHQLSPQDQDKILEIGLRFCPGNHKMVALPAMMEGLILEGRALFRDRVAKDYPGAFDHYGTSRYIASETILNNLIFGRTKSSGQQAREKISKCVNYLLIEENLLERIIAIGMQFEVGNQGDNLSGGQRQKLAMSRVFLKKPKLLIMDEATAALDNRSQARIQNLIDHQFRGNSTVISVVHRLDIIKNYDKIAVMKAGKIIEMGTYDGLMEQKGVLYELVFGKR